eukprot:TRINITY_DN2929_c0_g1_i8.p1 TRINITY_DN2929_c0_g1~~TRINITY_DN2929_c0_g1_i8.p1  ORF type:complete len:1128 (+),score=373.01 TRINITY_DN2929_c0_g1_i8:203-3586(+)
MKLQEVDKNVTVAWSCLPSQPALLAGGTVAGSLDSNFDTSAHLEILSLDLARPSKPLQVLGSTTAPDRFHKLCWGMTGVANETFPQGVIAGGLANGTVNLWDASKIISGAPNPLIACVERHSSGPVQGLDFNPFVPNLLASGGSDAEILIWDLSNAASPTVYTPAAGAKPQEAAITCVSWNRKVQHILASSSLSGVTVVWDLKNKRAILNLAEPTRKLRCRSIAWHPDEATQIVTSSEDDSAPILQLWDLRNTYSPVSTLEGHTRGVFSVSWSSKDTDLLLSCGKDDRTLCWNVRTGDIQCEVDGSGSGFNFNIDVQWSPRLPAMLATTSLDGKLRIHSLADVHSVPTAAAPAADYLGNISAAAQPALSKTPSVPPKWLRRPAGVSFGFGGKLVWFKPAAVGQQQRRVTLVRLVTEQPLVQRAERLENALNHDTFKAYCLEKIEQSTSEQDKATWSLLKVLFEQNQRQEILSYLGYDPDRVADEVKQYSAELKLKQLSLAEPAAAAAESAADAAAAASSQLPSSPVAAAGPPVTTDESAAVSAPSSPSAEAAVDAAAAAVANVVDDAAQAPDAAQQQPTVLLSSSGSVDQLFGTASPGSGSDDVSGLFSAMSTNDAADTSLFDTFATAAAPTSPVAAAVSTPASPPPAGRSLAPDASFGSDTPATKQSAASAAPAARKVVEQHMLLLQPQGASASADGGESLVTRALMVGNFELAVDCCIETGRMADALVLAAYGGPDLWSKTQQAYFQAQSKPYMRVISAIVKDELNTLVIESHLSQWHAVLAILCTYAKREDFPIYAGLLGDRLVQEARDAQAATLCYLCAGHLDKTVDLWLEAANNSINTSSISNSNGESNAHQTLQHLIEKISVFRRAINHQEALRPNIAERYAQYAEILASQGLLSSATRCLAFLAQSSARNDDQSSSNGAIGPEPFVLLDRLHHAQDAKGASPPFPFKREDVVATASHASPSQPAPLHQQPQHQLPAQPLSQPDWQQQQPVSQQPVSYQHQQPLAGVYGATQQPQHATASAYGQQPYGQLQQQPQPQPTFAQPAAYAGTAAVPSSAYGQPVAYAPQAHTAGPFMHQPASGPSAAGYAQAPAGPLQQQQLGAQQVSCTSRSDDDDASPPYDG